MEIKSEITVNKDFCYVVEPHHTLMDIARWLIKLTDSGEMKYCLDKAEAEKDSMDKMDFGDALIALKAGSRVAREGWNGDGMWVLLVEACEYQLTNAQEPELGLLKRPFLMMRTADSQLVPWVASQTDMLAEDWELV